MLDREVADAAGGVEHVRLGEGVGRAGAEAGRTGAAVRTGEWLVRKQFEIGKQCAEEKEAAATGIDQHRVLTDPAEPGSACEVALQERCGGGGGSSSRRRSRDRASRRSAEKRRRPWRERCRRGRTRARGLGLSDAIRAAPYRQSSDKREAERSTVRRSERCSVHSHLSP